MLMFFNSSPPGLAVDFPIRAHATVNSMNEYVQTDDFVFSAIVKFVNGFLFVAGIGKAKCDLLWSFCICHKFHCGFCRFHTKDSGRIIFTHHRRRRRRRRPWNDVLNDYCFSNNYLLNYWVGDCFTHSRNMRELRQPSSLFSFMTYCCERWPNEEGFCDIWNSFRLWMQPIAGILHLMRQPFSQEVSDNFSETWVR